MRPSLGRIPQTGSFIPKRGWIALTSRIAPMARHANDLQLLLHGMQGADGSDPYAERPIPFYQSIDELKPLRIAYLIDTKPPKMDPAILGAMEHVYEILDSLSQVTRIQTSLFEEGILIARQLFQADAGQGLKRTLASLNTNHYSAALESWLVQLPKNPLNLEEYSKLWANWDVYKIKFLSLFQHYDAVFFPVAPQCALPHGQTLEKEIVWSLIRYTSCITLTECPAVVIPCGTNTQGFPIGIQIVTKPWQDELALSIATLLEQVLPSLRSG